MGKEGDCARERERAQNNGLGMAVAAAMATHLQCTVALQHQRLVLPVQIEALQAGPAGRGNR